MKPLLSVIIPTKNRYSTLFSLVETLLSFNLEDFEIVIQDNSDNNNEAISFLEAHKHKYLKYYHSSEKLSVIDNSNMAVSNSTGDFVCFIGDDDGVMPYIVDVVKWMKRENVMAIKSYKPDYTWPGLNFSYFDTDKSGILKYKRCDYKISNINTEEALSYTLSKGGTDIYKLPCLYHGIVSRNILDQIYNKTKSYFPGPSPDMANAVALCLNIKTYKHLHFPVIISGKSAKSTGGQGVLHQHIAKIEDVAHLPKETKIKWTKKIPKYWTGPTIWAESVIKSLELSGAQDKIKRLNFSYLYAKLIVFNFAQRKQLFSDFPYKVYTLRFFYSVIIQFINRAFLFFINKLKLNKVNSQANVKNIGEAIFILNKEIDKSKLPF